MGLGEDVWGALKGAGSRLPGVQLLGGAAGFLKPAQANLTPAQEAQKADMALAQSLSGQRGGYGTNVTGNGTPGGGFGTPGLGRDTLQPAQMQALQGLQAAANGTAPSAAEMQLRQQADRNAAQQFGLAAALGGRTPGGALRQASMGSAQIQGQTNADAAALRANEQANARGLLQQALMGQAGLQQGTNQLNSQQYNALLAAQLQAMGYGTQAGVGLANASAQQAASNNQYKGNLISGGAALLGAL